MKTEKAIKQDREFVARVARSLPSLDRNVKQKYIENQEALKSILDDALGVKYRRPVDLGVTPRASLESDSRHFSVKRHDGDGAVIVSRKGDSLFIDDKEVRLFSLSDIKNERSMSGHTFFEELLKEGTPLNYNVLECLYKYPELLPHPWKELDEKGETCFIYFFGSTFYDRKDKEPYVRGLYNDHRGLHSEHQGRITIGQYPLNHDWLRRWSAAII